MALANAVAIVGLYRAMTYELKRNWGTSEYVNDSGWSVDPVHSGVLGKFHYWLLGKVGPVWIKPLASCMGCMASFHSLYFFWPMVYSFGVPAGLWWTYLIYIPLVSGVTILINNTIE